MQDDEDQAARSLAARRRRLTTPPPRMSPGRFWRRILLVMALVVVAVASQRHAFQSWSDRLFGAPVNWRNDYSMTEHLYGMIVRRHLTDVPRQCLLIIIDGNTPPQATSLGVFEKPTEACMGAAHDKIRILPQLFRMQVDRTTGRVESDSGSPGVYRPLN